MAHADPPVGPIPDGVDPAGYDRLRRRVLWLMPSGLYLLGAAHAGTPNLMTLNWATQVSTAPKLVAVGVEAGARTHALVEASGAFSLSVLRRADRPVVRAFVKPAAWDAEAGTLNGHPVGWAASGSPVLSAALAWLDCAVRHRLDCGSHTLFVGEVTGAWEAAGPEGAGGADGDVLRMEDTRMSYGG